MSVIRVKALHKEYGPTAALRSVDLEIESGGIVGILGPNGAGKTTLVEILEGLREPTSGTVRVLGLDPAREPMALKERLGVQLQSTTLPQDLTTSEVIRLFSGFYRQPLRADEVLERVCLKEHASTRVRHLSGGQRQRLALATAMVHDPELFVLDEPSSGLDPQARRAIHVVLRGLRSRGRTILLTSHYLDEIEQLADRVLVVRAGEIVADGTPFELLARASGTSTLWLAVEGPFDSAPLVAAGAQPEGKDGEHMRFTTLDPTAVILGLGESLRAQGAVLRDLRLKRPTLEDVYLDLVGEAPEQAGGKEAA